MTKLDQIVLYILFVGLILSTLSFFFLALNMDLLFKIELTAIFALGITIMTALYKTEVRKAKDIFHELFDTISTVKEE
jgi:hypothetical protein